MSSERFFRLERPVPSLARTTVRVPTVRVPYAGVLKLIERRTKDWEVGTE
jgi:hypothetical protein